MPKGGKTPTDCVAWARQVNATWLVHGGLHSAAAAYMHYLGEADPSRLDRSCGLARRLLEVRDEFDDPKPWFYGGLFSLATVEEARRYLAGHPFAAAVNPALAGFPESPDLADAGEKTRDKIVLIREKIREIIKEQGAKYNFLPEAENCPYCISQK